MGPPGGKEMSISMFLEGYFFSAGQEWLKDVQTIAKKMLIQRNPLNILFFIMNTSLV